MEATKLTFEQIPDTLSEILELVQRLENQIGVLPIEKPLPEPEPFIYGINGLAKFLRVSTPTAQKIKNSGRIPYSQAERTILFKKSDVLNALSSNKKR